MTGVDPPAADPLAGDPESGLQPHPDPDDWNTITVAIARAAGLRWPEAENKLKIHGRAKAQTLQIRLATNRPDWTPPNSEDPAND